MFIKNTTILSVFFAYNSGQYTTKQKSLFDYNNGVRIKMKKLLLIVIFAIVLISSMVVEAEGTYELIMEIPKLRFPNIEGDLLRMIDENGKTILYDQTGNQFIDAEFNRVTTGISRIDTNGKTTLYYEMYGESGMGAYGADSKQLVPCQYDDVKIYSDRWGIGVELEATQSQEDYDYFGGSGKYIVSYGDVYFKGEKIGRVEGRFNVGSCEAYGNYLCLKMNDGRRIAYDSNFDMREIERIQEYGSDFTGFNIIHMPTGKVAFKNECTLTEAEVKNDCYFDKDESILIDLSGNEIVKLTSDYDKVDSFVNGYAIVMDSVDYKSKYGVIDQAGKEIIPCEYDFSSLDDSNRYGEGIFANGYQLVSKNYEFYGFFNSDGAITCPIEYRRDEIKSYSDCFLIMNNNEVISAAIGKIPGVTADYYLASGYRSTPCIVLRDSNNNLGVIDMSGNTLLPFDPYTSITLTYDGKACLVEYPSGNFAFYKLNFQYRDLNATDEEAASGDWICTCGLTNNGNFCPNCGSRRP